MKKIWNWILNNPNRAMFLIPILLVAAISISHVVTWYDMANPINWAVYLSIAIEVGAMTALVAATNKIRGGVWFMFGLVTFIQMIGNIFYSYFQIDETGELFQSWIELTSPVWELMGTETTDVVGMKRWLAFLEGGLLPLISLTSLHFFVTYEKNETEKPKTIDPNEDLTPDMKKVIIEEELKSREEKKKDNLESVKEVNSEVDEIIKAKKIVESFGDKYETEDLTSTEEYDNSLDENLVTSTKSEKSSIEVEDIVYEEKEDGTDEVLDIEHIPLTEHSDDFEENGSEELINNKLISEEHLEGVDSSQLIEEDDWDEDHALDMVMNEMVEDLMEEEGVDTIEELVDLLEDESTDEEDDSPTTKQDVTINNKPPKRKMGIDRIR